MADHEKAKEQLIHELQELRQRLAEAQSLDAHRRPHGVAESDPAEIEAHYRSLLEHSLDAVLITEPDGIIKAANPAACTMFMMTEEEICRAGRQALVDMSDHHLAAALEERALTGRFQCDLGFIRKDGARFIADATSVSIGGGSRSFVILRDITERKRAEDTLRESEMRYRILAENATDVIWTIGMDMRLTYISPSVTRLVGFTPEEAMARSMQQAYTPAAFEKAMRLLAEEMTVESAGNGDPKRTRIVELEMVHRDGSTVPVEGNFCFLRDQTGKGIGLLAIVRDITERKRNEQALRSAKLDLEKRVEERTSELEAKTKNLEEVNTALTVLLDRREADRIELEESIAGNLKSLVAPYVERLQRTDLSAEQATYLSILQSHLQEIDSRFFRKLSLQHTGLTPTEMQVAVLIRDGKTTKEISCVLHVSEKAVEFHRNNLRRKLNITNKKENLKSHLLALSYHQLTPSGKLVNN